MSGEWTIGCGGGQWWTESEPNAWLLAELLRRHAGGPAEAVSANL